jgi:hypothetical protein
MMNVQHDQDKSHNPDRKTEDIDEGYQLVSPHEPKRNDKEAA